MVTEFDQPCSALCLAALHAIRDRLQIVMWNRNQTEYESPFTNTGNCFENEVFKANAHSWTNESQEWNFCWRDLKISWYKYCGRTTYCNKTMTNDEIATMLEDCLASLDRFDKETDQMHGD